MTSRLGKKNTVPSAGERRDLVAALRRAASLGDHLASSALLSFASQAELNAMLRKQIACLDQLQSVLNEFAEQQSKEHT